MLFSRLVFIATCLLIANCAEKKVATGGGGGGGETPSCGDGDLAADEECDNGQFNGDAAACTSQCKLAVCGDNLVGPNESCDNGSLNSDEQPDKCRSNCVLPSCGDGVKDLGEECDLGTGGNSDITSDICRTDCTNPSCGDGVQDLGEACDDGKDNSDTDPDACRTDCSTASCGDGVVDQDESCDAGPFNSDTLANACRTDCGNPSCGDGVLDEGEACDDGAQNSDSGVDACRTNCALATCGDGVVDAGEDCDDAGESTTCNANCTSSACLDGVINTTAGEVCDVGPTGVATASCDVDCSAPACDDGELNTAAGETCETTTVIASGSCDATTCTVSCDAGAGDCNDDVSDGCEINTNTDAQNCGGCGTSCYGGACVSGVCQPVTVASYVTLMNTLFGSSGYAATGQRFGVTASMVLWAEKTSTLGELRGAPFDGNFALEIPGLAAPVAWGMYVGVSGDALRWLQVVKDQVGDTDEYFNTATLYSAELVVGDFSPPYTESYVGPATPLGTTTFLANLSDSTYAEIGRPALTHCGDSILFALSRNWSSVQNPESIVGNGGNSVFVLHPGMSDAAHVVDAPEHIIQIECHENDLLLRAPHTIYRYTGSGSPLPLVTVPTGAFFGKIGPMRVLDDYVYFSHGQTVNDTDPAPRFVDKGLKRVDLTQACLTPCAWEDVISDSAIVIAASFDVSSEDVFFSTSSELRHLTPGATTGTVLLNGLTQPTSVVVRDDKIFWLERDDGGTFPCMDVFASQEGSDCTHTLKYMRLMP